MDIYRIGPSIESHQVLFQLTNPSDGTLQGLLDEYFFLRVDDLVVALLQPLVDINVLDVEHGEMLECLIRLPSVDVLDAQLVLLVWHRLDLHLLREVVHGIRQH